MKLPRITQQNFRILLPGKIAKASAMIADYCHCTEIEALMRFYRSKTYASIEKEATKFWWMSALQLFREYQYEINEAN